MCFFFGAGRDQGGLYSQLFCCSLLATFSMANVKGETQNAFMELSDATSNVVHWSKRLKFNKSTLGSIKCAIDALGDPVVRLLFSS